MNTGSFRKDKLKMCLGLRGIDGEMGMSQGPHAPLGGSDGLETPRSLLVQSQVLKGDQLAFFSFPGNQEPEVIFPLFFIHLNILDQCFQIRSQMSK